MSANEAANTFLFPTKLLVTGSVCCSFVFLSLSRSFQSYTYVGDLLALHYSSIFRFNSFFSPSDYPKLRWFSGLLFLWVFIFHPAHTYGMHTHERGTYDSSICDYSHIVCSCLFAYGEIFHEFSISAPPNNAESKPVS